MKNVNPELEKKVGVRLINKVILGKIVEKLLSPK